MGLWEDIKGGVNNVADTVSNATGFKPAGDYIKFMTGTKFASDVSDALTPEQSSSKIDDATQQALAIQAQQQAFLNQLQPQNALFANQLAKQALGQQMSPAMQQALQQNQAAQVGLMKSMKGGNQALAQRNLAQNAQQAQQQAMLGGTAQAQGMYGNYLGQQQNYNAQLMGAATGSAAAQAQAAATAQTGRNQLYGGIIGGMASALPLFVANGGQIPALGTHYANYFSTMKNGGQVPGYNQGGTTDSLKNDTVPTMLSPGEIVIPKSVVNGPNPKANAAKFVEAILAKQGMRK